MVYCWHVGLGKFVGICLGALDTLFGEDAVPL